MCVTGSTALPRGCRWITRQEAIKTGRTLRLSVKMSDITIRCQMRHRSTPQGVTNKQKGSQGCLLPDLYLRSICGTYFFLYRFIIRYSVPDQFPILGLLSPISVSCQTKQFRFQFTRCTWKSLSLWVLNSDPDRQQRTEPRLTVPLKQYRSFRYTRQSFLFYYSTILPQTFSDQCSWESWEIHSANILTQVPTELRLKGNNWFPCMRFK